MIVDEKVKRRRTHAEWLGAPACGALLFVAIGLGAEIVGALFGGRGGEGSAWGLFHAAWIGGVVGVLFPRAVAWFPDGLRVRNIDVL